MIVEHATVTIRPDGHEAFLAAIPQVQDHLLASQVCRAVELYPSVDRDEVYLLRITWDTLEDHTQVFPASDHGRAVLAELGNHAEALDIVHFAEERTNTPA